MGIPGLYKHIGNGERIALSKLAVDHYIRYARKLRIAIDASIWLFQVKSGRGGPNPEIRTLYYRLLKLLALGIEPVFIFDGPGRPDLKRNKQIDGFWESPRAIQARALLDAFGFVHRIAPGEAEAECACLQKAKIVDAVMSEDIDTLMFGATMTLKNWSYEGGGRIRTHIDVFHSDKIKSNTRLEREGMVLVALMRGADYDMDGIKGCGLVTACEAARAGFGHDLCKVDVGDAKGFEEWRERLQYELETNESGFFKTKHKSIRIDPEFPNPGILHDYMHPLVSTNADLEDMKIQLRQGREPDIPTLRTFVAENFGWDTLPGAKRLIRGLAPPLLTHRLLAKGSSPTGIGGLLSVCGMRMHHTTDGMVELRVEILPITLVPLDLDKEPLHRADAEGEPVEEIYQEDSESEGDAQDVTVPSSQSRRERSSSPAKKRAPSKYNPNEPAKFYVAEFYTRRGAGSMVEAWEAALKEPKLPTPRKPRTKNALAKTGMPQGAIESFFGVKKSSSSQAPPPPAKKVRPVEPVRSKTDTDKLSLSDQPLTNLWAKRKENTQSQYTPKWAEQQYYDHIQQEMARKPTHQPTMMATGPQTLEEPASKNHLQADGVRLELYSEGRFSSPISSQDLSGLVSTSHQPQTELARTISSPISSQDLMQVVETTSTSEPTARVKSTNVRIRESLEGAWTTTSLESHRRGTRLSGVDSVDLT